MKTIQTVKFPFSQKNQVLSIIVSFLISTSLNSCKNTPKKEEPLTTKEIFLEMKEQMGDFCGNENLEIEIREWNSSDEKPMTPQSAGMSSCMGSTVYFTVVFSNNHSLKVTLTFIEDQILLRNDWRDENLLPIGYPNYGGFATRESKPSHLQFDLHNFGESMWPGIEPTHWEWKIMSKNEIEYSEWKEDTLLKKFILSKN